MPCLQRLAEGLYWRGECILTPWIGGGLNAESLSGFALCAPATRQESRLRHRSDSYFGPRHWRQHRHLQRDRFDIAAAAAVSSGGKAGGDQRTVCFPIP